MRRLALLAIIAGLVLGACGEGAPNDPPDQHESAIAQADTFSSAQLDNLSPVARRLGSPKTLISLNRRLAKATRAARLDILACEYDRVFSDGAIYSGLEREVRNSWWRLLLAKYANIILADGSGLGNSRQELTIGDAQQVTSDIYGRDRLC